MHYADTTAMVKALQKVSPEDLREEFSSVMSAKPALYVGKVQLAN